MVISDVKVLPPKGLNTSIYLDLNHFSRQTAWAHGFMHAYALWLGPVLLVAVFLAAYGVIWWRRSPRAATLMGLGGIGTLVALGLNQLVGHAAKELRPYDTHPHALVLVAKAHDYSFPSDHAVIAGSLMTAVLLVCVLGRQVGRPVGRHSMTAPGASGAHGLVSPGTLAPPRTLAPPPLPSALAVTFTVLSIVFGLFLCFARVYVGAHYPGDVVSGLLLGVCVVVVVSLFRPLAYWVTDRVEDTPLGALLRRPALGLASREGANP
ncbi:MAG: phosphatase PAP2 family protein [Acidimicrobiales bacterium]